MLVAVTAEEVVREMDLGKVLYSISQRRPRARRDPQAVFVAEGVDDHRLKSKGRGVWVPAFAGTTGERSSMTAPKSIFRTAPSAVSAATIVSSLLTVQTRGAGFTDLTSELQKFVREAGAREGVVTLFIRHTSASLTIQENADPTVLVDLTTALNRLAPENAGWRHDTEGPDDMPAHIKTMLTATSLQVPVLQGVPALGTWQAIYLVEHRARPLRREVVLQFIGSVD